MSLLSHMLIAIAGNFWIFELNLFFQLSAKLNFYLTQSEFLV